MNTQDHENHQPFDLSKIKLVDGHHSDMRSTGIGCAGDMLSWMVGDERITDAPACVCPSLPPFYQAINDAAWSSTKARTEAFVPVMPLLAETHDDRQQERKQYLARMTWRVFAPWALRAAGLRHEAYKLRGAPEHLAANFALSTSNLVYCLSTDSKDRGGLFYVVGTAVLQAYLALGSEGGISPGHAALSAEAAAKAAIYAAESDLEGSLEGTTAIDFLECAKAGDRALRVAVCVLKRAALIGCEPVEIEERERVAEKLVEEFQTHD